MRWVIMRVLVLWLTLIVICVGVIGVARRNPAPDVLQSLGFGVCDGEPCYKGMNLGMDWGVATDIYRMVKGNTEGATVDPTGTYTIAIIPSDNWIDVDSFDMEIIEYPPHLPIFLGQIIAEYGVPECVKLLDADGPPHTFFVRYPGLTVRIPAAVSISSNKYEFRLQPESPVLEITLTDKNDPVDCSSVNPAEFGSWHGFAAVTTYFARFRSESGKH